MDTHKYAHIRTHTHTYKCPYVRMDSITIAIMYDMIRI